MFTSWSLYCVCLLFGAEQLVDVGFIGARFLKTAACLGWKWRNEREKQKQEAKRYSKKHSIDLKDPDESHTSDPLPIAHSHLVHDYKNIDRNHFKLIPNGARSEREISRWPSARQLAVQILSFQCSTGVTWRILFHGKDSAPRQFYLRQTVKLMPSACRSLIRSKPHFR